MTQADFFQEGSAIDYTPASAVSAGDVVELGNRVLVAKLDIVANTLGALATRGVFDVAKVSGAITAGDGVTGGFDVESLPTLDGGLVMFVDLNPDDVTLRVAVPEPATFALVALTANLPALAVVGAVPWICVTSTCNLSVENRLS